MPNANSMLPPTALPRITCISVVGRQNNPLHIAVFPTRDSKPSQPPPPPPPKTDSDPNTNTNTNPAKPQPQPQSQPKPTSTSASASISPPDPLILNYHFLTHTTLDIFALRLPLKTADQDFGLLYAISEDLAAYGWCTNTGVKFVVFVTNGAGGLSIREGDLRPVFKELQTAYIRLVCNPFYDVEDGAVGGQKKQWKMITSKKFMNDVRKIGESWVPASLVGQSGVLSPGGSASGIGSGVGSVVGAIREREGVVGGSSGKGAS